MQQLQSDLQSQLERVQEEILDITVAGDQTVSAWYLFFCHDIPQKILFMKSIMTKCYMYAQCQWQFVYKMSQNYV